MHYINQLVNTNLGCNFITSLQYEDIDYSHITGGEFKHEVRQFQKPYDNQQAEQTSLMV